MSRKVALDARTDQALTHMAALRRSPGRQVRATIPVADDLARLLAEQFPADRETAGRALMTAGSALASLLEELRGRGLPDRVIEAALLNTLGFAAEALCRDGEGR